MSGPACPIKHTLLLQKPLFHRFVKCRVANVVLQRRAWRVLVACFGVSSRFGTIRMLCGVITRDTAMFMTVDGDLASVSSDESSCCGVSWTR